MGEISTPRSQSERAARSGQNAELVWALLNATGEGIYGVDLDGDCTFANPFCVSILGYDSDAELLGRNMHDLIHHTRTTGEPYPVEDCRIYQAYRERMGVHVGDEIVWRADGSSFPAEYWSYPVEIDGELVGCVVAFVDITDRRRAEEDLRQSEKLAALGKLAAGLAHELNNPAAASQRAAAQMQQRLERLEQMTCSLGKLELTDSDWDTLRLVRGRLTEATRAGSSLGALERADREEAIAGWLEARDIPEPWDMAAGLAVLDELQLGELEAVVPGPALGPALDWIVQSATAHELVETIATSMDGITRLVGAVKSYSYMDRAPEQEIDVHDGIESTLTILGHKTKAGTRIVRDYDRSLPPLHTRPGELNQVWTNLLDNAVDAAGPDGEVRIHSSRERDGLLIEVADNGHGIPEEIQDRIFDPFFTTKDVGSGTGLGLDVARRIVTDRCGGEISVESRPGNTRFRVWLPLEGGHTTA